ncbi:TPA: hypothetical protein ACKFKX_005285, partial [Klebsiella pneumoniae]
RTIHPPAQNTQSPHLPGFFVIMGYHKGATKRMIGVYTEVYPWSLAKVLGIPLSNLGTFRGVPNGSR